MTSRRPAVLMLAAAAVVLTACAPAARADWAPPAWEPAAVHAAEAPAAIDAGPAGPLATVLTGVRLRNDAVGVQARVSLLPDTPQTAVFNAAMLQHVRAAIDARVAASGVSYTPVAAAVGSGMSSRRCELGSTARSAAELLADPAFGPSGGAGSAVLCDIVAARGPFIGESVRVVSGTPDAVAADTTMILYADTATGEIATADALWADGAAAALGAHVVDALRRDAGSLTRRPASPGDEAQLAAVRAALSTTIPVAEGFVVTVPAGFTSPELSALGVPANAEPMVLAVPADLAASLVTPFGARMLAAAGQPYTGPAVAPAGARAVDCALVPCVAVTYDDGPSGLTAGILDELARYDSAATFFAMGANAHGARDVLARMTREGHEVANHTWNHPQLPKLTSAQVSAQINDTTRALEAASGQRIDSFRPPYGEFNASVLAAAGLPAILWDVDTLDWQKPPDETLVARAVEQPRAGSIVLMHDVHAGTARVAGTIFQGLLDRGFTLVTVRQLFGGELPASGAWRRAP
ncbi:polysaccharide deacetylase family protein [Microbacterium sp. HD4P20]|uniref:polysaccharide deacetylase family protein n=1 Tax=Microbacterium sp. HD4P20 TaxID=2864874 RepID=UPI001C64357C|nr:polysaccharide deacetylase family protein [Microbacterium sp. HD4P20]MCP2635273.1 polysaccharide deacetylase family protein [Microbacterium sp. HD4P20]